MVSNVSFLVNAYDINKREIRNLVQWDKDVYIYIHERNIGSAQPMHFFNQKSDVAYVVETTFSNGVLKAKIPNLLLQQAYPITGYIYVSIDGGNRSVYRTRINIEPRQRPSDYIYVDTYDYVSVSKILNECRQYASDAESARKETLAAKEEIEKMIEDGVGINADWDQNDESAADYIKNKPIEETEDDAMEMLADMGIVDPVTDEEGNVLTDENGNILII